MSSKKGSPVKECSKTISFIRRPVLCSTESSKKSSVPLKTTDLLINKWLISSEESLKNENEEQSSGVVPNAMYEQFVNCINCCKLIRINDVEFHTDNCYHIKEDVIISEFNSNPFIIFDFKLRKLEENINHALKESNRSQDTKKLEELLKIIWMGRKLESKDLVQVEQFCEQIKSEKKNFAQEGSILSLTLFERMQMIFLEKLKGLRNLENRKSVYKVKINPYLGSNEREPINKQRNSSVQLKVSGLP